MVKLPGMVDEIPLPQEAGVGLIDASGDEQAWTTCQPPQVVDRVIDEPRDVRDAGLIAHRRPAYRGCVDEDGVVGEYRAHACFLEYRQGALQRNAVEIHGRVPPVSQEGSERSRHQVTRSVLRFTPDDPDRLAHRAVDKHRSRPSGARRCPGSINAAAVASRVTPSSSAVAYGASSDRVWRLEHPARARAQCSWR